MALKAGRVGVNPSQVDSNGNITGGGSSVTVVDNLNSNSSTNALSAKQGKVLKGLFDDFSDTNPTIHNIELSNSTLQIATDEGATNYYVEIGNKVIVFLDYKTISGGATYTSYPIATGLPAPATFYTDVRFPSHVLVDNVSANDLTFAVDSEGVLYQLNRYNAAYTTRRYVVLEYYKA